MAIILPHPFTDLPPLHIASALPSQYSFFAFAFDQHLNFRQIVLGIAAENHPGPFVIDLTGRELYLVALRTNIVEDLGVRLTELVVWPFVQKRNTTAARKAPDRDSIDRFTRSERARMAQYRRPSPGIRRRRKA